MPRMFSRVYGLSVLLPLLACLIALGADPGPLRDLRNGLFDLYQRADPRPFSPDLPVRIVDIDDASLARIGQWPWPRSTLATLVERLAEKGAAVIAFDMVFAEPDRLDTTALAAVLPEELRGPVLMAIGTGEGADALFAKAMARAPAVLGAVLSDQGPAASIAPKWGIASAGDDPLAFLPHFSSAVVPLPALGEAAAGIGALNWLPDRDQVVRRVPLLLALGKEVVPSLAAEALRVAQGASTYVVRASNASGEAAFGTRSGMVAVKIGAFEIPTEADGALRLRFGRSDPRRFIPAHQVLDGTADADALDGRIILVGTSAAGLKDTRATPLDAAVPGVEIQAQLIEQVATGAFLTRPDWARGAEILLAGLFGLLLAVLLPRVSPVGAGISTLAVITALAAGSFLAFTRLSLLIDPLGPAVTALAVYLGGVLALYRDEQKKKRWVREVFGRFVSPQVVERLAEQPQDLVLGGQTRELTILFCDLRDFTTLSETMDAEALTRFMRAYLTPMTEVVLAHGGTIDKYIGDAIMAFWNAPVDDPAHARNAASCALAMVERLKGLNAGWRTEAEAAGRPYVPVRCGIGLATGPCCVGNLGSAQRLEYSCLGDDVNLASRIEGATKALGADVLVSEATRAAAPELAFLEAGTLTLKGKTSASRLFLLAGDETVAASAEFRALAERHEALARTNRNSAEAMLLARDLARIAPAHLARFYAAYGKPAPEPAGSAAAS